jgi:uncharacterized membrane protein
MSRITPYWPETQNTGRVPTLTPGRPRPEGTGAVARGGRPRHVTSRARRGEFPAPEVNVGDAERMVSAVGGSALALYGLSRGTLGGLFLAALGGSLAYRGLSGHCPCYAALGTSTAEGRGARTSVPAGEGCRVEHSVTINRPAHELYTFWRNFENLPQIMRHLKSVRVDGNRSHWVAEAPLGISAEWDAEVITERPDELIGWRSLPGSCVDTAGSVHFTPAPGGRGTEVRVNLKYDPPAGKVGAAVANWLGEAPERQIAEDLNEFKRLMEGGQAITARGQSRGR